MESVEVINIKVDKKLKKKLTEYTKLIGANNSSLIRELITAELDGKILTNDYITLDKPLYFNEMELYKKGKIKATPIKPAGNIEHIQIIKRITNNLDSFNKTDKSYYYKEHTQHKGIIFNPKCQNYYLFELNKNSLFISIVTDLTIIINANNKKTIKDLLRVSEDYKNKLNKCINTFNEVDTAFKESEFKTIREFLGSANNKLIVEFLEAQYIFWWKCYQHFNCFMPFKLFVYLKNMCLLLHELNYNEDIINKNELKTFLINFKLDDVNEFDFINIVSHYNKDTYKEINNLILFGIAGNYDIKKIDNKIRSIF